MEIGHCRLQMPSSSISKDLSLADTLQVLPGSSTMAVGKKDRSSPYGLLRMRLQCRGCYLSRSAVPDLSGQCDSSSVRRRTVEMRLTAVAARAQCAEFLT